MKRILTVVSAAVMLAGFSAMALAADVLVLKDFEGKFVRNNAAIKIEGAEKDYAGPYNGPNSESTVEVVREKGAKGEQCLLIHFNKSDWAGVGFDYEANPITSEYKKFRFTYKGLGNGYKFRLQFSDNGKEQHEFVLEDDSADWKTVELAFADAVVRTDWQPEDKDGNETLDFPMKSMNIESYDSGEVDLYVDQFEVLK